MREGRRWHPVSVVDGAHAIQHTGGQVCREDTPRDEERGADLLKGRPQGPISQYHQCIFVIVGKTTFGDNTENQKSEFCH